MQALLYSVPPTLQQATADPPLCWRDLDTHGQVWVSPSWCTRDSVCALQESVSPVLCKFWWLYGGVNGDLFREGLCHTQACCTPEPLPRGSPLLMRTSIGDTQTQFWGSLWGLWVLMHTRFV